MENLNTILIIAALIQLITLIVFFVMAGNVSAIKKELQKELSFDDYIEKSNEEKFVGNKTKAKEWLLRVMFHLENELERIKRYSSDYMFEQNAVETNKQMEKVTSMLKELELN